MLIIEYYYELQEFIHHLIISLASNDETIDHIETLFETKSLTNKTTYTELHGKLEILGKKLNSFIKSVQEEHKSPR